MFRIEIPKIDASGIQKMYRDASCRDNECKEALENKIEAAKLALVKAHDARTQKTTDKLSRGISAEYVLLWSDREWDDTVRILRRLYSFEAVREAAQRLSIDVI